MASCAEATANQDSLAPAAGGGGHIVIFPFMAKGHIIPFLHLAAALVRRSVDVSFVTTPANLPFVRRLLPTVRFHVLPFPSSPLLPAGVESTDALPSLSLFPAFLSATVLLRQPFADLLSSFPTPPLAVVSDYFLGFTYYVCAAAGIPRMVCHCMSAFSIAITKSFLYSIPESEPFRLPSGPSSLLLTRGDLPMEMFHSTNPMVNFFKDEANPADVASWGIVINSCDALDDPCYVRLLESFYCRGARGWLVGPLQAIPLPADTGMTGEDEDGCITWLDARLHAPGSVLYISFGTQANIGHEQLNELVHGLVSSGHAFLWAVRAADWMPPINIGPSGKIARQWIPQKPVLNHPAVGGFLSHCGWNSVQESLLAGVPILAWPMIADTPVNAKHIVDNLGVGIRLGTGLEMPSGRLVSRATVADGVRELMGEGGQHVRKRAGEVGQAMAAAVADGGTSSVALDELLAMLRNTRA